MPTVAKAVEHTASIAGAVDETIDAAKMWKAFQAQRRLGMLYKAAQRTPGLGLALGAIEGSFKSIDDANNGQREKWLQQVGGTPSSALEDIGWDSLRTAENIGNALTYNQANRLGNLLSKLGK